MSRDLPVLRDRDRATWPAVTTIAGVGASVLLLRLFARVDPPWGWLGWIALVPWLASLDRTTSLRQALTSALAITLLFVLAVFGWFAETIRNYTGASTTVSFATVILLAPVLEPQFLVFAAARHLARRAAEDLPRGNARRFWYVALTGACSYIAAEWLLPKLFHVTLGYGLHGSRWVRQAADIIGVAGLTFALLIVNECVLAITSSLARSEAGLRLHRRLLPAALAVPLGLSIYGGVRCRQIDDHDASANRLRVAAVQANISNYERIAKELGTYDGVRYILDAHYRLSTGAIERFDPDLVIWPETVYPTTFGTPKSPDGAAFDREIGRFVASSGRPLVFGSYDAEGERQFNAAVFLSADRDGRVGYDIYRKALLFPFTERVPALFDSPRVRRWFPWFGTWTPGPPPQPVTLALANGRQVRIAPLICYDALESDPARTSARAGADLIVTLSNDSWFATDIAPRVHLIMAAFRSIETRLPQVRATNTGISAVITANGDIVDSLPTGVADVLLGEITLDGRDAAIVRSGDWFSPIASIGAVLLLLVPLVSRSRG